jgi:glycine oxidase
MAKSGGVCLAVLVPDEVQIRNPWHLKALVAGCIRRGVTITPDAEVQGFDIQGGRVEAVHTTAGRVAAGCVCVTTGSWSSAVLALLGVQVQIKPIRGQIVLLRCARPPINHIIYEGPHYLVPRDDGHVLVGSTLEDVGFDKRNTTEAVDDLLQFAGDVAPALREAQLEQSWAGLRPSTVDGLPYFGRIPNLSNAFVAAGHFRSGLQLSPGTAVIMGRLIRDEPLQFDLTPFRLDRS